MPLITDNGIEVPIPPDIFRPTTQLKKMADTTNVIRAVSGTVARDALPKLLGMQVMRTDRDNFVQSWDGTKWVWITPPARYSTTAFSSAASAVSRVIATINPPVKTYATRVTVRGRLTVTSGAISAGSKIINVCISTVVGVVASAQGKSQLAWNSSNAGLNQNANLDVSSVSVPAGTDPVARLWIEDLGGSVTTTPSGGPFASFTVDILPEDD